MASRYNPKTRQIEACDYGSIRETQARIGKSRWVRHSREGSSGIVSANGAEIIGHAATVEDAWRLIEAHNRGMEAVERAGERTKVDYYHPKQIVLGKLSFEREGNEVFLVVLASDDPDGDGDHVATAESITDDVWAGFVDACRAGDVRELYEEGETRGV